MTILNHINITETNKLNHPRYDFQEQRKVSQIPERQTTDGLDMDNFKCK